MTTIFDSPLFLDFEAKMLIHLETCDINNPNEACIDSVLPGVVSRLDKIDGGVNTLSQISKKYKQTSVN